MRHNILIVGAKSVVSATVVAAAVWLASTAIGAQDTTDRTPKGGTVTFCFDVETALLIRPFGFRPRRSDDS